MHVYTHFNPKFNARLIHHIVFHISQDGACASLVNKQAMTLPFRNNISKHILPTVFTKSQLVETEMLFLNVWVQNDWYLYRIRVTALPGYYFGNISLNGNTIYRYLFCWHLALCLQTHYRHFRCTLLLWMFNLIGHNF